jgi:hypothetical protein
MVRLDETTWLKCGVELVNGVQQASVVVTREYSDWSVVPLPDNPPSMRVRVSRHEGTFEVHCSVAGGSETLLRQAFLTERATVDVGVMSASPTGDGFKTRLQGLRIHT